VWAALSAVITLGTAPVAAEGLETEPVIGGRPMRCLDFRGLAVRTLRMTELGDVGRAWIVTRMPIIALDPDRLATLPGPMQVFFYVHECAHHVLAVRAPQGSRAACQHAEVLRRHLANAGVVRLA
jgi:hypothetical protein